MDPEQSKPQRYMTMRRMIALRYEDDHHGATTIPERRFFQIVNRAEDPRFLVIALEPDGELVQILESDLTDRCTTRDRRRRGVSLPANAAG